ncbi:LysR family transcriptional regulator [Saccharopolyspora mangrovi]|uniref:LysR family transcriptional regulator n=1 Tax=Saccharopolyspora mangrovi TaxID=3082379 RepID=A0ABU6AF56_9PSEU|nr:LysR family transcriptional regulator [Saccharopolyspora sp. S2-29]MEB3370081.1 LysR family transcriptional regulator [Saccharopolyspora sp. S2-29]
MELRDDEILLVLAEELHFGRTAERLHITPSRVSQCVKAQERRVGAALFERTSRKVVLTPIGRQLVDDLGAVQRQLRESLQRAEQAARGTVGVLRIGMIAANVDDLRPYFDAFAAERPGVEVQIRTIGFADPFAGLRSGELDVVMVWLPVREPDLTAGPVIHIEPVVLALSSAHPLARRETLSLEDLGDLVTIGGAEPAYWREAMVPSHTPGGRPIAVGPTASDFLEMLPILSTGEAVSPVHLQATRYFARPDVAYIPIHDAAPARWALVWRTSAETDAILALAKIVEQLGPLEQ